VGWFIFLLIVVAAVVAFFWAKKHFRQEIDRAKRINRANRDQ
jgi:type VI protein secretion system component VasF